MGVTHEDRLIRISDFSHSIMAISTDIRESYLSFLLPSALRIAVLMGLGWGLFCVIKAQDGKEEL